MQFLNSIKGYPWRHKPATQHDAIPPEITFGPSRPVIPAPSGDDLPPVVPAGGPIMSRKFKIFKRKWSEI